MTALPMTTDRDTVGGRKMPAIEFKLSRDDWSGVASPQPTLGTLPTAYADEMAILASPSLMRQIRESQRLLARGNEGSPAKEVWRELGLIDE